MEKEFILSIQEMMNGEGKGGKHGEGDHIFLRMRRRMGNIELIPTQCKTGDSSWQGAALVSAEAFRQPP